MKLKRSSGILLHVSSLPSEYGIGDLGPNSYKFVDLLNQTNCTVWQILPLTTVDKHGSPYSSLSAFAGNPMLISPELLIRDELITEEDAKITLKQNPKKVDFKFVKAYKEDLLKKSYINFKKKYLFNEGFEKFKTECALWLDDCALFFTLIDLTGTDEWTTWKHEWANRDEATLEQVCLEHADKIEYHQFVQYIFFKQWFALKRYASQKFISIMGDIPIFVALKSADIWAHRELFQVDAKGHPLFVSGVPPDCFSETGQLWGNPLYNWEALEEENFAWWMERFKLMFELYDYVRVDHFVGFSHYWSIPAGETTAIHGEWIKASGKRLFKTLKKKMGNVPIIAEDLGKVTSDVEKLRDSFDFPGMKVLGLGFLTDEADPNYPIQCQKEHCVIYTGTHDNNTALGWYDSLVPGSLEKENTDNYFGTQRKEMNWVMINWIMKAKPKWAIVPLQDIMGLGEEARMNWPGRAEGNWHWRFTWEELEQSCLDRYRGLIEETGRTNKKIDQHYQERTFPKDSIFSKILKWLGIIGVNIGLGALMFFCFLSGHLFIGGLSALVLAGLDYVVFNKKGYPYRYMFPGLLTFLLFMVLPIIFTMWVGFTNLGTGHMLSYKQVKNLLLKEVYILPDAPTFSFVAAHDKNNSNKFDLYLTDNQSGEVFSGTYEKSEKENIEVKFKKLGSSDIEHEGGVKLTKPELLRMNRYFKVINAIVPKDGGEIVLKQNEIAGFAQGRIRYELIKDKEGERFRDVVEGKIYTPDFKTGFLKSGDETLSPGFSVSVGSGNFKKLFTSPDVARPFIKVFIWTFVWAFMTVLLTFSVGMILSLILNVRKLRGRVLYRMLLIIPYSIPFFISVLIFKGMLNYDFGVINQILISTFGIKIPWLVGPMWAKASCLLVNLWLGFPYMLLVITGILQSIPDDIYEAAALDGSSRWTTFSKITMPLVMSAIAPLLVGSFAFNLNNFVGIYLLTGGLPPMQGVTTPVGETDILISYTYRLAFEGGQGQDFGMASAIAILIFIIISILTIINFRISGIISPKKAEG